MQNEMIVVNDGNRQMQIGDVREMMVHDMLEMNGKNDWFSSKLVAEQSRKKHFTILRDIKLKAIDFAGGEKYWESVVTGGKNYYDFKCANLNKLFKLLVVDRDKTVPYHEFLDGLKYTFDERGYVKEIEMNGYVANHLMMSYSNKMLWDWQMYTRSLYAENTELIADKFLGIFDERATFNYDALTKNQKIEVCARYSNEQALEAGLDINPGLIPNKVMKKISDAKKIPYVTKRNKRSKTSNTPCTDNRRFNKGSKTGRRWLVQFGFDENRIFTLNEVVEQFETTEARLLLFLVDHNIIKRDAFLDKKIVATPYFISNKWGNRTLTDEWHEDYQQTESIKGIEFTAHGLRYISKALITQAKKYSRTSKVGTTDIKEFLDTPFNEYCSLYRTKI